MIRFIKKTNFYMRRENSVFYFHLFPSIVELRGVEPLAS